MREQLKEISRTSIMLADFEFPKTLVEQEWLGYEPATDDQIAEAENRLGLSLPEDYKEFLRLCNGFHAPNNVEPTFLSSDKIDYLERIDPDLTKIWTQTGNIEIARELKRCIMIAGLNEEQHFLLIPPRDDNMRWRYWKFASWLLGEQEYDSLVSYWLDVLQLNKEQVEDK